MQQVDPNKIFILAVNASAIGVKPHIVHRMVVDHMMSLMVDLDAEHSMKLGAISAAAGGNTAEAAAQRIKQDHPHWSVAYQDVCSAVDRELKEREFKEACGKNLTETVAENTRITDELERLKAIDLESILGGEG